jgi:Zn-dependent protease with chaperone function
MHISEPTIGNTKLIECPECKELIPEMDHYVTWCDKCNWNLQPEQSDEPSNFFEKLYLRVGNKSNAHLLQSMTQKSTSIPKFSASKLLAVCMASLVHLVSLTILAFGCFEFIRNMTSPFMVCLGIMCVLLAWLTRPRINKLKDKPISREQFPTLYKVVDEIASSLQIKKAHDLVITSDYNAFYTEVGISRRKVIGLGLPLLSVLNKQETVAIISHEMAHGINGDLRRGIFVGSAIRTLVTWHQILRPEKFFDINSSFFFAICMYIANIFMWLISHVVSLLLFVICHLNWRDSQRAEFMADSCAAEIAGNEAQVSALKMLHNQRLFEYTVLKTINNKSVGSLFEAFQQNVLEMPEREIERINRVSRLTDSRLDATHPPTANRIDYIQSLDNRQIRYQLSDQQYERLANELSTLKTQIELKIIDRYKSVVLGI